MKRWNWPKVFFGKISPLCKRRAGRDGFAKGASEGKGMCFCGIDCSCYTSSVSIVDESGKVLADARRPLPVKDGQKGLRQSGDGVCAY